MSSEWSEKDERFYEDLEWDGRSGTISVAAYRAAVEEIGDINAVVLGRGGGKGKTAKARPDDRPGLFDEHEGSTGP